MSIVFPEEEGKLSLTIHLIGKSTNSQLINLEDLSNLAAGLNGLAHHIVKTKVGKQRTNEEVKRLCTLGIAGIRKGSAILEIVAQEKGQLKLGIDKRRIMEEVIQTIDDFHEKRIEEVDPQTFVFLDMLTRPLDSESTKLDLRLYRGEELVIKSKILDLKTHEKVKEALKTFRIMSGVIVGTLTEINLKTYSFQVQTIYSLEKIFFEPTYADTIISLLRKNVDVTFERESTKSKIRKLIDIRDLGIKPTSKKMMTAVDFIESGIIAKLEHRKDIVDSVEYSKSLRDEVFK